jgi:hypothetical protein
VQFDVALQQLFRRGDDGVPEVRPGAAAPAPPVDRPQGHPGRRPQGLRREPLAFPEVNKVGLGEAETVDTGNWKLEDAAVSHFWVAF